MKILLVDDQPLFLEGLGNLLAARGYEVLGTAQDGLEALTLARRLRPEVILMDVRMPRCDGVQATRLIKTELPDTKVVMLTVSADDEDLFEAIRSGASGYLLKSLRSGELFSMLELLAEGDVPLSRGLVARILDEFARQGFQPELITQAQVAEDETGGLNARQTQILSLVAKGLTYQEIGSMLCLSERTVKYHMANALDRLHLKNRAQAISYVERRGARRNGRELESAR